MAQRYIQQANSAVTPVYNQAQQGIQQQTSALDMLYSALFADAQAQQQAQVQNIAQSAEQRGVGRAGLEGDLVSQFQPGTNLGIAELNAQRMGQRAELGGLRGQAQEGRVNAATDLGGSIQQRQISDQQFAQDQRLEREQFNMEVQAMERQDQLRAAAYAQAQARAAANSVGSVDKETATSIEALLESRVGGDGKVNPKDYYEALDAWQKAGGSTDAFTTKFDRFVNNDHAIDYYDPVSFFLKERQKKIENRKTYRHDWGKDTITMPGVSF